MNNPYYRLPFQLELLRLLQGLNSAPDPVHVKTLSLESFAHSIFLSFQGEAMHHGPEGKSKQTDTFCTRLAGLPHYGTCTRQDTKH